VGIVTTDKSENHVDLNTRGFRRLTPFDYLVLLGGFINLLVVSFIIGSWLFY